MRFSRKEDWSGLPFLSPGDLPEPEMNPGLLHCRQILYWVTFNGSFNLHISNQQFWAFFSCTSWPSVYLLLRNVYLDLLQFFDCIFYLFIWYWASWAIHKFWRLIPCWLGSFVCKYFLPFCELSYCLWFPFLCKSFNFNFVAPVHLFYFCYSSRWIQKDIPEIYVKQCSAYVSLLEFYSTWPYI